MSTLRRIWKPVAEALELKATDAHEVLFEACMQSADGDEDLALRIHGALAARYGLRRRLVPPRRVADYGTLPSDPLAGGGKPIRVAFKKAAASSRGKHLVAELEATASLARKKRARGQWVDTLEPHPTGNPAAVRTELCVDCAWGHETPAGLRCRRAARIVEPDQAGCACWEPPLSGDPDPCAPCGACCRGVFDHAPVRDDDPELPQDLVEDRDGQRCIPHDVNGACRALSTSSPWRCGVHSARPLVCRDFPVGGDDCCEARRNRGLVPPVLR